MNILKEALQQTKNVLPVNVNKSQTIIAKQCKTDYCLKYKNRPFV